MNEKIVEKIVEGACFVASIGFVTSMFKVAFKEKAKIEIANINKTSETANVAINNIAKMVECKAEVDKLKAFNSIDPEDSDVDEDNEDDEKEN